MRPPKFALIFAAAAVLFAGLSVRAQETFSDPHVAYSFTLPAGGWKMTAPPSPTNPNVEYVYGDRRNGHLEVRRLTVAKTTALSDLLEDEDQRMRFRPGYVAGSEETFNGRLKGAIFNFEYVSAGRSMSGRFYFLRADDTTVYVIRFVGGKDELRSLRNQTDAIARTFDVKGGS